MEPETQNMQTKQRSYIGSKLEKDAKAKKDEDDGITKGLYYDREKFDDKWHRNTQIFLLQNLCEEFEFEIA